MQMPKFSQEQIKLAFSSSAGVYLVLGGVALLFGLLSVLNSIPLLSEGLEVLGLVYAYQNKAKLFSTVAELIKPSVTAAQQAILPGEDDSPE